MNIHELILQVQGLLGRNLRSVQSDEERELLRVAAAALMFISETGAVHSFDDYLRFRRGAPPLAVAAFKTREEADTWLRQSHEPPHGAFVLIADDYHIVMHVREMNHRQLFPHPILEGYLEQLRPIDSSSPLPSFETRGEAADWLKGSTETLQEVHLRIAGRRYIALYHRNLGCYSIHLLRDESPGTQDGQKP